MRLRVRGPNRSEHFMAVTDCYQTLEQTHEDLLDVAFGFADDDGYATVDVEVTVNAEDEDAAILLARSSVRSAIQDAGGYPPGWDEDRHTTSAVAYRIVDESVDLVPA